MVHFIICAIFSFSANYCFFLFHLFLKVFVVTENEKTDKVLDNYNKVIISIKKYLYRR